MWMKELMTNHSCTIIANEEAERKQKQAKAKLWYSMQAGWTLSGRPLNLYANPCLPGWDKEWWWRGGRWAGRLKRDMGSCPKCKGIGPAGHECKDCKGMEMFYVGEGKSSDKPADEKQSNLKMMKKLRMDSGKKGPSVRSAPGCNSIGWLNKVGLTHAMIVRTGMRHSTPLISLFKNKIKWMLWKKPTSQLPVNDWWTVEPQCMHLLARKILMN